MRHNTRDPRDHVWAVSCTLWDSIAAGIAGLAAFAHTAQPIAYPHRDTASALRGDWLRIGRDMNTVIGRRRDGSLEADS